MVQSDSVLPSEAMELVQDARSAGIWVTKDALPTTDNNSLEDGGKRSVENPANFNLVPATGTNLRSTDLAPGATTPMHRTSSLDYNILISGELILITEDGETHLKHPGDIVIQKGTMHAWRNPSSNWTRWVTVLIAAEPAVVNGKALQPALLV